MGLHVSVVEIIVLKKFFILYILGTSEFTLEMIIINKKREIPVQRSLRSS